MKPKCITNFVNYTTRRLKKIISRLLNINGDSVNYDKILFEKESEIEGSRRRTNFDFYFETSLGRKIYFEIKYTEKEFGKAKEDDAHIEKYNSIYKKHCDSLNPEYSDRTNFLRNYQLMRNLIHLSDNSYLVFVYPNKNKKIKEQAENAKTNFVKPKFQQNLINLTWEQLVGDIDLNKVD